MFPSRSPARPAVQPYSRPSVVFLDTWGSALYWRDCCTREACNLSHSPCACDWQSNLSHSPCVGGDSGRHTLTALFNSFVGLRGSSAWMCSSLVCSTLCIYFHVLPLVVPGYAMPHIFDKFLELWRMNCIEDTRWSLVHLWTFLSYIKWRTIHLELIQVGAT